MTVDSFNPAAVRDCAAEVHGEVILALETSTLAASVALLAHGRTFEAALTSERRRTGELFPRIQQLFRSASVRPRETTVVAFSGGPGSFTGLRMSAAIARMFRSVTRCDVVVVPSLVAIAANQFVAADHPPAAPVAVCVDARGGLIFGAIYEPLTAPGADADATRERWRCADVEFVTREAPATHRVDAWLNTLPSGTVIIGDAIERHAERIQQAGQRIAPQHRWTPLAQRVAQIGIGLRAAGRICASHEILPAYIRPPECEEVYEQRRAAARARRA